MYVFPRLVISILHIVSLELNMLNKQTFLDILEMTFINLNSTEKIITLIQLILLVYESYV